MSQWKDAQGRKLPLLIVKSKELPRQFASPTIAEIIGNAGIVVAATTAAAGPINAVIMILVKTSLNQLWSAINS